MNNKHDYTFTIEQMPSSKFKYHIIPADRPEGSEKEYNTYEEAEGEAAKRILYIYTNHKKYKSEDGPVIFSIYIIINFICNR